MFGRKGASMDLLYLTVVALVVGVSTLVALYVRDATYPVILPMINSSSEAQSIMNNTTSSLGVMDYLFASTYIMMAIISIIFAAMVRNHPVFLVISIILTMVMLVISPLISNVMLEIWSQPQFAGFAEGGGGTIELPLMTRIFQYLPHITAVLSIFTMIVSFSKSDESMGV